MKKNKLRDMNETEKKLYDYAQSVEWDFYEINEYIGNPNIGLTFKEYEDLKGFLSEDKATNFINKYKTKEPTSITLPIEDYNKLRKLEIKSEIKKLKQEYKKL